MTAPNYALGLDCERRKRRILNKAKALLTSDGKKVEFQDGSDGDRIVLALIEKAYAEGVVTIDGAGQLQVVKPDKDGTDRWLGHIGNVFGFHPAPDNGNRFTSTTVEERECGKLALLICDTDGITKLAKFPGCEGGGLISVDANGNVSCQEAQEIPETPEPFCRPDFLIPIFLDTPVLVVDKWPGLNYISTDGTVGIGSGSLEFPQPFPISIKSNV